MRIVAQKEVLASAIGDVLSVVPLRTTLPILSNFLMEPEGEKLRLYATDLDISISQLVDITPEGDEGIAVPARKFAEIIRELPPAEVEVESEGKRITIRCGEGVYELGGAEKEDFPQFPKPEAEKKFSISGEKLCRMVEKTVFAVSTDQARPVLNGVLWQIREERMNMVATDGHRLAKIGMEGISPEGVEEEVIVPPKVLHHLLRFAPHEEVEVLLQPNSLIFNLGPTLLYSRLLEGPYPDYEMVIPKENDKLLVANRELLTSAIKRVSILSNQTTHQIRFSFKPKELELDAANPDLGGEAKEIVEVEYKGEKMEIGYNAYLILDALKQIEGERVVIELKGPLNPGLVREEIPKEGEDYLCLVMPLKLVE